MPASSPQKERQMRADAERVASSAPHVSERANHQKMKHPIIFGCPSCDKLFPTRRGCNTHIEADHDIPLQPEGAEHMSTGTRLMVSMAAHLSKPERAKLLFHPQATEEELKTCLFKNLPWQDKAMLMPGMSLADMDLCYVTKRLVLRPPRHESQSSLSAW